MSIATVRIAPVERWCKTYNKDAPVESAVGMEIEILPGQMQAGGLLCYSGICGGKWWPISAKSAKELSERIGGPPAEAICEHMLEMD